MNRLVTGYIFREMAWPFVAAMLLTNMVLLLLQLLQLGDVVFGSAFSLGFLVHLVLCTAPHYLVITLPLSTLTAAVIVFGRMADENELMALEAGGIAPGALYPAPLVIAVAASALSLWVQLYVEPWGMRLLYARTVEVLKDNTSYNFQAGVFNDDIPGTVIYFDRTHSDGRTWEKIFIYQTDRAGDPVLLSARTGTVHPLEGERGLSIDLNDGTVHQSRRESAEYRIIDFKKNTLTVDIGKIIDQKTKFFQSASMLYPEDFPREIASRAPGSPDHRRLEVIYHAKFATACAALLLVLAAVPLAAARFRSGRPLNIALSLGVLVAYYLVMRVAGAAGEAGRLGPVAAAWMPNLALCAIAALTPRLRGVSR